MNKKVLLTGGAGFVGSHVLDALLVSTDWDVVCICSWGHRGLPIRTLGSTHYQKHKNRVTIITHDLQAPLSRLQEKEIGEVDYVLNIASESHVDRSISDPVPFINNNVNLVLTMLEWSRRHKVKKFIQFSTDEVYGVAPKGVNHKEWAPIIPSNPYAASKAAQEAIAISYWRTYGIPVILTNTMNVLGERQDPEKFLPKIIRNVLANEVVPIHSYPDKKKAGSRFYIHARNVADALIFILNKVPVKTYEEGADKPERLNIVGEKEWDNLKLAQFVSRVLEEPLKYEMISFHESRPGHDLRYALDGTKLRKLGWKAPKTLEESLTKAIKWYEENIKWLMI